MSFLREGERGRGRGLTLSCSILDDQNVSNPSACVCTNDLIFHLIDQLFEMVNLTTKAPRVSNQKGVSLLYIMLEIHHAGREPSNFIVILWFNSPTHI